MDQTVRMTRANQFPFIRVYYGEGEEVDGKLLDEVDQSESFGFEETEGKEDENSGIHHRQSPEAIGRGVTLVHHGLGVGVDRESGPSGAP